MTRIKFPINNDAWIELQLPCAPHDVLLTHLVKTYLIRANEKPILIRDGVVLEAAENIQEQSWVVLRGGAWLPERYGNDIGYIDNEDRRNENIGLVNDCKLWALYDSHDPKYTTWLYNDKDKHPILEIAPTYRWFYGNRNNDPDYIPYEEFIKNYKTLVKYELDHETLLQWYKTGRRLYNTILGNWHRLNREWYERYKRHKPKPMFRKQWRRMR